MLCDPTSYFPSKIDDLTFFQDIDLNHVDIMETYNNLIKEGKYNEANVYINKQNNMYGYFACFFNLIENRIYSLQHYLLSKGEKNNPFMTTGKNLLKNEFQNQTINGITFTVNDTDGSITLNGTASQTSTISMQTTLSSGNYILNGCSNGASDLSTYYLSCQLSDTYKVTSYDGDSVVFRIFGDVDFSVQIVVNQGVTLNNVKVYPMIRYAEISDGTYEKYKANNGNIYI